MSKNKNITWDDIRVYKKLPNRKKKLLTNEFLTTFKDELIKVFSKEYEDLTKETYWSFYSYLGESCGFDEALKIACKKHNLTKAIYEYGRRMQWYEYDAFSDDLTRLMVEKGIIEEGKIDDIDCEKIHKNDIGITKNFKILREFKGYNVVEYDWCFIEDIKYIENIYKDEGNVKLTWIN